MAFLILALQLWWSTKIPNDPKVLLDGSWQSCRDANGYGERIFEERVNGVFKWEFHMGPYHDFGLYATVQPDEHDHADAMNLLAPDYSAASGNTLERDVPSLGLHVSVHAGGGSRDDCESYYVMVTHAKRPGR